MEHMHYTAEFTGFLRTVLIILVVIYALRFLAKLLAPWMMRKAQSRIQNMAEEQMRQRGFNPGNRSERPEGSVTVEKVKSTNKTRPSNKKSDNDDYVDFEVVE